MRRVDTRWAENERHEKQGETLIGLSSSLTSMPDGTASRFDRSGHHCYLGAMRVPLRSLLTLLLCALLSLGAPISFAEMEMPCESMMAGDEGASHECGCDMSDQAACMAHCYALSHAQLSSYLGTHIDLLRAIPLVDATLSLRSYTGTPGNPPPK
jgi:hypothetical protein